RLLRVPARRVGGADVGQPAVHALDEPPQEVTPPCVALTVREIAPERLLCPVPERLVHDGRERPRDQRARTLRSFPIFVKAAINRADQEIADPARPPNT